MPTPTKGPRLGGGPAHERLILANLAQALFEHDRVTTTEAKAKRLRPYAERLITFAKRGDLHSRRRVMSLMGDSRHAKGVIHRLFTEIAVDVETRPGGYTRITKIPARKGDNAPMAVIELVREPYSPKQATVKEAEAATARAARTASAPAVSSTEATGGAATAATATGATDAAGDAATAAAAAPEGSISPDAEVDPTGTSETTGVELTGAEPAAEGPAAAAEGQVEGGAADRTAEGGASQA